MQIQISQNICFVQVFDTKRFRNTQKKQTNNK